MEKTSTSRPVYCGYCDQLATHIYDGTEELCRTHFREHRASLYHTTAETRAARNRAKRRNAAHR